MLPVAHEGYVGYLSHTQRGDSCPGVSTNVRVRIPNRIFCGKLPMGHRMFLISYSFPLSFPFVEFGPPPRPVVLREGMHPDSITQ